MPLVDDRLTILNNSEGAAIVVWRIFAKPLHIPTLNMSVTEYSITPHLMALKLHALKDRNPPHV